MASVTIGKDPYDSFVEHPRYGKRPGFTGPNPQQDCRRLFIHWHLLEGCRISGTAPGANLDKQTSATVPVTHYCDLRRSCRACGRPFIFFAAEQQRCDGQGFTFAAYKLKA